MGKTKKRENGITRIWKSLWNNPEDPNDIKDPDPAEPEVGIFNLTIEQQNQYYEQLKVKTKGQYIKNKDKSRNELNKSKIKRNNENVSRDHGE